MQIALDKIKPLPSRPSYGSKRRAWARRGRPGRMPVILAEDGSFYLLSGHFNVKDAERAGVKRLECLVRKNVSDEECDELQLSDEYYSSLLPPMKMAKAFINFRKKYGISQQELARRTRITAGTIHHYESLLKTLAPKLRKHVDNGDLTFKEARGIADIDGHNRQVEMAQPFIDGRLSSVYVESLVSRAKSDSEVKVEELVREAIGDQADDTQDDFQVADDSLNGAINLEDLEQQDGSDLDLLQDAAFRIAGRLERLAGTDIPEYRRLRLISTLRILSTRVEAALGHLNGGQARRDRRARPMTSMTSGIQLNRGRALSTRR